MGSVAIFSVAADTEQVGELTYLQMEEHSGERERSEYTIFHGIYSSFPAMHDQIFRHSVTTLENRDSNMQVDENKRSNHELIFSDANMRGDLRSV